jgi:hypothetical protein
VALHADAHRSSATILGNELVLDHFSEDDPEVVRYVAAAASSGAGSTR